MALACVGICGLFAASPALAASPTPAPRLTIEVARADIHTLLRLIADVSRLNIVVGEDVRGTVSLRLRDVPWTDALDAVLASLGLGMERLGTIVRVAPLKVLQEEAKARAAVKKARQEVAPLVTRIIPVNYARAEELLPHVKALLSPRGTATFDARTNVLIVRDVE
ncbi:MAG TPA: secretin N-terminal domain-containing protein [Myxococcaceae bacterium]|nr:secretin N-terminal domain-containing protein [Myxococcaceae bacterium]